MKLERVNNPNISFLNHSKNENNGLYSKIGEVCTGLGFSALGLEMLVNQNPGLLVNLSLAATIISGAVIANIPEYKIKE